jgi:hypothetical protein
MTTVLDLGVRGEWSALRPGRFYPWSLQKRMYSTVAFDRFGVKRRLGTQVPSQLGDTCGPLDHVAYCAGVRSCRAHLYLFSDGQRADCNRLSITCGHLELTAIVIGQWGKVHHSVPINGSLFKYIWMNFLGKEGSSL